MNPQDRYQQYDQRPQFELTPEERRIFKECSNEGIYNRAIPMGIVFGVGGLFGARAGPLMHKKFGVKPAVIALGCLGYAIGRLSYGKVCIQRVLKVPNGNMRKMYPTMFGEREHAEPEAYYATIDVPKTQDPERAAQSSSTDIDVASTSNFDTIPSEYYDTNQDKSKEEAPIKNYASYDDLRTQNRQDYSKRYYPESNPQNRSAHQQEGQAVRRPTPQETKPSGVIGGRTKYGDAWEV